MAITKEWLEEMELNEDAVDAIIEAHAESVDYWERELEKARSDAEEVVRIEEEIARLKSAEAAVDWKTKYEVLTAEFEAEKAKAKQKEVYEEKAKAYRTMLIDAGMKGRYVDLVMKSGHPGINNVMLVDGKVQNPAAVAASIRMDWGDLI